jgi:hypothetical protein
MKDFKERFFVQRLEAVIDIHSIGSDSEVKKGHSEFIAEYKPVS